MLSERVIDSRYVSTQTPDDDGGEKCKSRLCLAGHQDPDLVELMELGELASPTNSNVAKALAVQIF